MLNLRLRNLDVNEQKPDLALPRKILLIQGKRLAQVEDSEIPQAIWSEKHTAFNSLPLGQENI